MDLNRENMVEVIRHLAAGSFGVRVREVSDKELLIESVDPVMTVSDVGLFLLLTDATVRGMEKRGVLRAMKTKGTSGSMRFRKSIVIADFARAEKRGSVYGSRY